MVSRLRFGIRKTVAMQRAGERSNIEKSVKIGNFSISPRSPLYATVSSLTGDFKQIAWQLQSPKEAARSGASPPTARLTTAY
jgi:hypothetical protein